MATTAPFGAPMRQNFQFAPTWRNFNHGSFGAIPKAITARVAEVSAELEEAPDLFFRRTYPELLLKSRQATAKLLNAPTSSTVFVANATTGVNTVLRNLVYNPGDVIINLSTAYIPCDFTAAHLAETTPAELLTLDVTYPISESKLVEQVRLSIESLRAQGKNPRIVLFDTISAMPAFRLPYAALVRLCRETNVLSLVDGAHGIGLLPLDLSALDPDFFVTNLHKWLFNPRGCAALYVAERSQHLIRTCLPTSWGFVTKAGKKAGYLKAVEGYELSPFELLFSTTGTVDPAHFCVVPEVLAWREQVCGGEEAILKHNNELAVAGCKRVAEILGTGLLDVEERDMAMGCVKLPMREGQTMAEFWKALEVLDNNMVEKYSTFVPFLVHDGKAWARLSAQVYLSLEDYEWLGHILKEEIEKLTA